MPVTTASFTAAASLDVLRAVFRSDDGEPKLPLLDERVASLQAAAQVLMAQWEGLFVNMLKAAGGSAMALLRLVLDHFPTFRDIHLYDGRPSTASGDASAPGQPFSERHG